MNQRKNIDKVKQKVSNPKEIKKIREFLDSQKKIVFAYLYGSFINSKNFRDIDIAVYLKDKVSFKFIVDLKAKLSKVLNLPCDIFDIRILNGILKNPDAFSLLFLERLFKEGKLIVNKDFKVLGEFLEKYSNKYREAQALLKEVR